MGLVFGLVLSSLVWVAIRRRKNRTFVKKPKLVGGEKPLRPLLFQLRGWVQPTIFASLAFAILFGFGGVIQGCSQPGVSQSEKLQQQFDKVARDVTKQPDSPRSAPTELNKELYDRVVPREGDEIDPDLESVVGPTMARIGDIKRKAQAARDALKKLQDERKAALQIGQRLPGTPPAGIDISK